MVNCSLWLFIIPYHRLLSSVKLCFLAMSFTLFFAMVNPVNSSTVRSADFCGHSTILNIISEGIPLLDALLIVTRSLQNCRVLGYYGGIPKLTALMKGIVFINIC